ncbi:translation factor SUA5 [Flavobacterium fryxellicola]|uniref:Threonylcarbamoyl-AMP synthase n=1 Tax=Flavobacterium fryxellicola TaxID=249352 RepID=A0A167Y772_9FLAO|nr:L-threonylcarbamoyladenylate synthase [Flavobacterium fryxellicola]OAB29094.1 translation factor (SUA5) [Flavobacterium fryxellicola]SHN58510.1 translation factor SUA5 [Flavobacterium fryxellicola]
MISSDIELAVELLKKEDIIGFPTETVYGLAGNIYSEKAIDTIYRIKQRPSFNPLIVHIKQIEDLNKVAIEIPESARILAKIFWPGPLTLLLKKHESVPNRITAGKPTVAVRIPNHPVALSLLHKLDFPVAAPSANPFSSISPTSAEHVENYFGDELPMVLDGGVCKAGIESTIVGFHKDEIIIYRLGAISKEEIEKIVGPVSLLNKNENAPEAPGMLSRHYAPKSTLFLTTNVLDQIKLFPNKKIGLLLFKQPEKEQDVACQIILSPSGNFQEATSKLYASLHELDSMQIDIILAERFPDNGLGRTINDRLERAAKNI